MKKIATIFLAFLWLFSIFSISSVASLQVGVYEIPADEGDYIIWNCTDAAIPSYYGFSVGDQMKVSYGNVTTFNDLSILNASMFKDEGSGWIPYNDHHNVKCWGYNSTSGKLEFFDPFWEQSFFILPSLLSLSYIGQALNDSNSNWVDFTVKGGIINCTNAIGDFYALTTIDEKGLVTHFELNYGGSLDYTFEFLSTNIDFILQANDDDEEEEEVEEPTIEISGYNLALLIGLIGLSALLFTKRYGVDTNN